MKKNVLIPKALLFAFAASCWSQSHSQQFQLDPGHTLIEFNVERFMVGEVTGKFNEFDGYVTIDDANQVEAVQVTIQATSLDTDHEVRDGHLKSAIWLDTENYDQISFASSGIRKDGDQLWIDGTLTIKDQSNEVSFPFELKGPFKDPTGMTTIGLSGDLIIDRQDYGIQFSRLMDNGELFIGNEVRIRIRALAARQ